MNGVTDSVDATENGCSLSCVSIRARLLRRKAEERIDATTGISCGRSQSGSRLNREAQAVFIGGNGMLAIGAIKTLEARLRKPVLSANQIV